MTAISKITSTLKTTEELEALMTCSISLSDLENPVVDTCGHTFEKEQIETWLLRNHTCPISRQPLTREDLIPNRIVKRAIEILNLRGRSLEGRIEERGADEKERAILLLAMEELRPKTFARNAGDCVEKASGYSSHCF